MNKMKEKIIDLIKKHFTTLKSIRIEKEFDPETPNSWTVFCIDVIGKPEEIILQYNSYTKDFINTVPCRERNKYRISFNII